MRKKTISNLFDYVFWYVLYSLPLILCFIAFIVYGLGYNGSSEYIDNTSINTFFSSYLGNFFSSTISVTDNLVYDTLFKIFGVGSQFFQFFSANSVVLMYLTYFILLNIVHVIVDVILFVPRVCHKLLDTTGV